MSVQQIHTIVTSTHNVPTHKAPSGAPVILATLDQEQTVLVRVITIYLFSK
jgi:hypothetical protein